MRRIWRGPARLILARGGARAVATCSRASCWRCGARCRGARCRSCRSRSCCCRGWFPFHIDKVSYWSRTVLVPLLVLMALRPTRPQPARHHDRRVVHRASRGGAGLDLAADPDRDRPRVHAARPAAAAGRADISGRSAAARDRPGRGLRHRAAQRRGRARRHFPGDGERADDVRLPGLSAGSSELRGRRRARCASCSSPTASAATASPASRRYGTPRSPRMR